MVMQRDSFGSLSDIRILDLTQMLAGPFGTMMLADHGAEVIKVEAPGGDMTRHGGPFFEDDTEKTHGGYFQSVNRNKKSICLDLKTEQGRDALRHLVRSADAIVENFRHGVMDRLGLSYESLKEINPKLVYGTLRGFGDRRTGASPYVDWPAFDVVAQAMGGIMGITGPAPDQPTKVGPGVGDLVPGMMLALGILSAIHHARRTGEGQFVDVSMVDSILSVCERMVYQQSIQKRAPGPEGNHHPFICPFGMFPASDGHVTIAAQQDSFFGILCKELEVDELATRPEYENAMKRGANKRQLIEELSAITAKFTKAELTKRLGGKIPFGPVFNMDDVAADPHFTAREMLVELEQPGSKERVRVAGVPIKLSVTPGGVHHRGPYLGEDTEAVLNAAGYPQDKIEKLKTA